MEMTTNYTTTLIWSFDLYRLLYLSWLSLRTSNLNVQRLHLQLQWTVPFLPALQHRPSWWPPHPNEVDLEGGVALGPWQYLAIDVGNHSIQLCLFVPVIVPFVKNAHIIISIPVPIALCVTGFCRNMISWNLLLPIHQQRNRVPRRHTFKVFSPSKMLIVELCPFKICALECLNNKTTAEQEPSSSWNSSSSKRQNRDSDSNKFSKHSKP